eukprot:366524-Pleurochrysis_carterae.AAC.1
MSAQNKQLNTIIELLLEQQRASAQPAPPPPGEQTQAAVPQAVRARPEFVPLTQPPQLQEHAHARAHGGLLGGS